MIHRATCIRPRNEPGPIDSWWLAIKRVSIAVMLLLIPIWMWMLSGCSTPIRQPVVITLPEIRVHIVPSYHSFPTTAARKEVVGCATTGNEIFLLGEERSGEIIVDDCVLGHEMRHLLNWKDGRIQNPDE